MSTTELIARIKTSKGECHGLPATEQDAEALRRTLVDRHPEQDVDGLSDTQWYECVADSIVRGAALELPMTAWHIVWAALRRELTDDNDDPEFRQLVLEQLSQKFRPTTGELNG